jgi:hypothetical protein
VKDRAKIEYYRSLYVFFRKHRGGVEFGLLKACLFIRFCADFLITLLSCLVTAFRRERIKKKLFTYAKLIYWHLRLCPEGMGIGEG